MKYYLSCCILILSCLLTVHRLRAQEPGASATPFSDTEQVRPDNNSVFRIAYLRSSSEGGQTTSEMNRLREWLLTNVEVLNALQDAGYDSVGLYEADGSADLLPRLRTRNFDLVFSTSTIWHQSRDQYGIILQQQNKNDILNPRTGLAMRRGVIFISARHSAFDADWSNEQWRTYLSGNPLAVVQSQSLSGYITPMLQLRDDIGIREEDMTLIWCRSGSEVTRSVISGLVDAGACEERDLESTLRNYGLEADRDRLVKIIYRTAPVPTTPVLATKDLIQNSPDLVLALQRSLRTTGKEIFSQDISFNSAKSTDYQEVSRLIDRFESSHSDRVTAP